MTPLVMICLLRDVRYVILKIFWAAYSKSDTQQVMRLCYFY